MLFVKFAVEVNTPEKEPELYSIPLDLARPISWTVPSLFVSAVPLVVCLLSTSLTAL